MTATVAVVALLWWGQRFLIPLTAGVMLAMLVMPLTDILGRWLHSIVAATVLTLLLVLCCLGGGALAFGNQLLSVADRAPEMISMAATQLAKGARISESPFARAKDSLQQLDRAADQLTTEEPANARSRRAAAARAATPPVPGHSISLGAAAALRNTAMTGSAALLEFAGNLSIIFFIAFFVLIVFVASRTAAVEPDLSCALAQRQSSFGSRRRFVLPKV